MTEPRLETVATEDLTGHDAHQAEALVRAVFGSEFEPHDWVHALGGTHVLARLDGLVVAHAAAVPRLLVHDGKEIDGRYVEAVAVDSDRRGTGLGRIVLDRLEAVIEDEGALGVLNSLPGAIGFWEGRGWVRWRGLLGVVGNGEDPRPPADGENVMVFRPPSSIDVEGTLCVNNRVGPRW